MTTEAQLKAALAAADGTNQTKKVIGFDDTGGRWKDDPGFPVTIRAPDDSQDLTFHEVRATYYYEAGDGTSRKAVARYSVTQRGVTTGAYQESARWIGGDQTLSEDTFERMVEKNLSTAIATEANAPYVTTQSAPGARKVLTVDSIQFIPNGQVESANVCVWIESGTANVAQRCKYTVKLAPDGSLIWKIQNGQTLT